MLRIKLLTINLKAGKQEKATKTILYQSAYLEDLYYVPDAPSPEKAGFFNLRSDLSAHPDARKLSIDLENLLKVN